MPKKTEITCDGCGNDLTTTGNGEDFRLALINERVQSAGGFVTDVAVYPAIKGNAYFCGIDCLRSWLNEKYPADKAPYHGGKWGAGYQRKLRQGIAQGHSGDGSPAGDKG